MESGAASAAGTADPSAAAGLFFHSGAAEDGTGGASRRQSRSRRSCGSGVPDEDAAGQDEWGVDTGSALAPAIAGEIVPLNVGGSAFTTTRTTLSAVHGSLLAELVAGRSVLPLRDATGAVFIDRDASQFHVVLDFLRSGRQACLLPDSRPALVRLAAEARYYRLPSLVEEAEAELGRLAAKPISRGLVLQLLHSSSDGRLQLPATKLCGLVLSFLRFVDSTFTGCDFAQADLSGSDLGRCQATFASFAGANLTSATLAEARLERCVFKGATMVRANLAGADLRSADFTRCDLRRANLTAASVKGAVWEGATLEKAVVIGVDLRGADMQGLVLREANFEGSDLSGALLRGSDLSRANLWGSLRATNLVAVATAMLLAGRGCAAKGLSGSRPNIVWILADDLGYGEPSYMQTVSPHGRISTPNIDQLSSEGLRFTSAYTGEAVCSPSRGSLMTGYHTGHAYIRGNYPYDGHDLPLRDTDVTYAEVLRSAGYRTQWVGKSGLGWVDTSGSPWRMGFDYYYGQPDQAGCHDMYPVGYNGSDPSAAGKPTVFDNATALYLPQNADASREQCMQQGGGGCWYTHDAWTNKSLELIQREAERQRAEMAAGAVAPAPFALLVAYTDPHAGGWSGEQETGAPVPSDGAYAKEAWPDVERDHASVISNYLDRDVGRIVQALRDQGLEDDTVLFFASDNGAHDEGGHDVHFFNSSGPLRGYKRALYEGGVRTPSWVRWPGKIAPGTSDQPWAFWDVLPTFADLAGANRTTFPSDIDGRSIVPLIDGGGAYNASDRLFYFEFCTDIKPWVGGSNRKGWTHSLRQGDWKIVSFELDGEYMLFNLADDLGEQNNLAISHPEIVQRMAALAKGQHTESALFPSHDCRPS